MLRISGCTAVNILSLRRWIQRLMTDLLVALLNLQIGYRDWPYLKISTIFVCNNFRRNCKKNIYRYNYLLSILSITCDPFGTGDPCTPAAVTIALSRCAISCETETPEKMFPIPPIFLFFFLLRPSVKRKTKLMIERFDRLSHSFKTNDLIKF